MRRMSFAELSTDKMRRIPFSDDSVERMALGRKTQTRRVAKWDGPEPLPLESCPYFGDCPRVRGVEAWRITGNSWAMFQDGILEVAYRAGSASRRIHVGFDDAHTHVPQAGDSWHAPRFMFNWASRFHILLLDWKCVRLATITEADAVAEGAASLEEFKRGWDALNAARGFPFDANPWVWALRFRFEPAPDFFGVMDDLAADAGQWVRT